VRVAQAGGDAAVQTGAGTARVAAVVRGRCGALLVSVLARLFRERDGPN
jgi:hypothetical protein